MFKLPLVLILGTFLPLTARAGVLIGHPRLRMPVPEPAEVVEAALFAPQIVLQPCDGQPPLTLSNVQLDAAYGGTMSLPVGVFCGITFAAGAELDATVQVGSAVVQLDLDLPQFELPLPDAVVVHPQQPAPELELGDGSWMTLLADVLASGGSCAVPADTALAQAIGHAIVESVALLP